MALVRWVDLSPVAGALLVAVWIGKDLVLYPWLRSAYTEEERSPKDQLLEATGVVVEPLEPMGIVRLGAELWRAEPAADGTTIPRGRRVRIEEVRGLVLRVAETEEPPR